MMTEREREKREREREEKRERRVIKKKVVEMILSSLF